MNIELRTEQKSNIMDPQMKNRLIDGSSPPNFVRTSLTNSMS